ncbi:CrcB family protein [Paenibacillus psychroresistens]|uniref:Fluoride-specific ion channel FluC n=1 Tax=Paenibacillus psychroresistens TaxID=1778678 RepID=A0A6B8RR90_9BACL|nr:CrcB family protein [Paenibacillus psychroresistens]QGQ98003.1 CrcB family protein [Paenibacillus psychroresistens]
MSSSTKSLISLIIGGFIGAVLRFEIGEWMPATTDGFPWSTLIINLTGCLFLGWFLTITLHKLKLKPEIRLGLGTGMTGSFTTFSAFSVQSVHLMTNSHSAIAGMYIITSVVGGIGLCMLGVALARVQAGKPRGDLIL